MTTQVSPRIWGTADFKIVHVHVIGMEEMRVAEWLALRRTINRHDSPTSTKGKEKKETHFPPTILQSSRARWLLWALSEPLPLRSQSPVCSGGLLIWKIEERVDRLGRFLRPFGAELMHTHPPSRSRWCSAPRRGRPGRCPASRRRAAGAGTQGAALTGLGLTARVGNLQLEGEPGKRWLCRAASLPLAARKGLGQVLLSNTAGPVPGAGRWRGLAPLSARHGSQGWARRNTPPGGSEFPFRWTVFKSLRCQVEGGRGWGCSGESVALASGVFPRRRRSPPSPVTRPGRAGCPRSRQLVLIRCLDPSSPRGSPV